MRQIHNSQFSIHNFQKELQRSMFDTWKLKIQCELKIENWKLRACL